MRKSFQRVGDMFHRLIPTCRLAGMLLLVFAFSVAVLHTHSAEADDDHEHLDPEFECSFCLVAAGKKWTSDTVTAQQHVRLSLFSTNYPAAQHTVAGILSFAGFTPRAPPVFSSLN